jgi:hypothetical protein
VGFGTRQLPGALGALHRRLPRLEVTVFEEPSSAGSAEISVHAVNAGPDTASLLEVPVGAAVFAIERLTRLQDGRPVDLESMHIRADRLILQATLHRAQDPT